MDSVDLARDFVEHGNAPCFTASIVTKKCTIAYVIGRGGGILDASAPPSVEIWRLSGGTLNLRPRRSAAEGGGPEDRGRFWYALFLNGRTYRWSN